MTLKLKSESAYLSISNMKKCTEILNKSDDLTEGDMIDFLISLHLTLEVNLNALFRGLSNKQLSLTNINEEEIIENIDKIDFIAKTTLFIYNSKFKFNNKLDEIEKHHKIIQKLIIFNQLRNKLLHGHSILTISQEGEKGSIVFEVPLDTTDYTLNYDMPFKNYNIVWEAVK